MRFFDAAVDLPGPPSAVWGVLVDGAAWPSWGSGVTEFDGEIRLGARVRMRTAIAPTRSFSVRVDALDEAHLIEFVGGMPLGLFRGRRIYRLDATTAASTTCLLREEYSGRLVRLIWPRMPDLTASFEQFVNGLKAAVLARALNADA